MLLAGLQFYDFFVWTNWDSLQIILKMMKASRFFSKCRKKREIIQKENVCYISVKFLSILQRRWKYFLKSNHPYFYQVQTQMLLAGLQFYDFFVWTNWDSLQIILKMMKASRLKLLTKQKIFFARHCYQSLPPSTL